MIYNQLIVALAISAGLIEGTLAANNFGNGGRFGGGGSNAGSSGVAAATGGTAATATSAAAVAATSATTATTNTTNGGTAADLQLNPSNVQTGSQSDGLASAEAGQAASATDPANFINFCTGKTLTNGLQVKGGSCNGIVMGDIPASTNMISSIITNPGPGDTIAADTDFTIDVQVANLDAGSFTNPDVTYYAAPQALKGGNVVGHTHVTVQTLGANLAPTQPPNAVTFAFFKGINDAGNGAGSLSAKVAGGLPAGSYRVCTMTSSSNHQPVLMPVAQRGAQDDCQKFTVSGAGNSTTAAAGGATAATSAAAAVGTTGTTGNKGGRFGGGRFGRGKFTKRQFIA